MIDYKKIWESINRESEGSSKNNLIARKIPSKNSLAVYLATDFRKNIRSIYIKLDGNQTVVIDKIPHFRGLEIKVSEITLGEYKNAIFLVFSQSMPQFENIFEAVISDISNTVINITDPIYLSEELIKIFNDWKTFFEKSDNAILTIEKQKGLFGELSFLKEYILNKYRFSDCINFWIGANGAAHDFHIYNTAIEVKTTSSKQHKKIIISNENQLDYSGLDNLYLFLFSINIKANSELGTLPLLVSSIFEQIKDDSIASYQFEIKLIKYGYILNQAARYSHGFNIIKVNVFKVKEGFPRLIHSNLPEGVGDLKYSIEVTACKSFELNTNFKDLL